MPIRCCGAGTCSSARRAARSTSRACARATSPCRCSLPPRSRRGTSTSSATTTAAMTSCCWLWRSAGRLRRGAGCCRGRSTWLPGPTIWRPAPVARSGSSVRAATWPTTRRRAASTPRLTAGLLAIEGAHALDGDPANVEVVADAGFRMMSPSHFFDNAFGGSAHGIDKGGPHGRRPRDGRDGWRRAGCWSTSRMPRRRRSMTSWRWPPGRSSPRTRGSAASPTTVAT